MRHILKTLLFITIFCFLFMHIFVIDVHASGIDDKANVLQGYASLDLEEYIDHAKSNKYELFFVTVKDVGSMHTGDYAKQYFDRNARLSNGVVVLYEENSQTITFITCGGFQNIISSTEARNYSDILTNSLKYGGCYDAFDTAGSYIRLDFNESDVQFDNKTNISLARIILPTGISIAIGLVITIIIVAMLIIQHNATCKKVAAQIYLDNTFEVDERRDRHIGNRTEVIRGYYNRGNNKR